MRRAGLFFICILLLTVLQGAAVGQDDDLEIPSSSQGSILSVSDIHFNPFFDKSIVPQLITNDYKKWYGILVKSKKTHTAGYGDETNFKLFNSALKAMQANCPNPDFILFSGDLLAHSFKNKFREFSKSNAEYKSFVKKTMSFISWQFQHYFPGTPIYFTLGNNDDYDDYAIAPPPADSFLTDTRGIFFSQYLKGDPTTQAAFESTFVPGGNYSAHPLKAKTNRIIVLNSIFFSKRNNHPREGWKQLQWLEAELSSAKNNSEKVWLVMHIPPGVDVKGTLPHPETPNLYWDISPRDAANHTFLARFIDLAGAYSGVVKAIFSGHTHMDHFRLVTGINHAARAFIHITPAISPQFNNNPGFQVLKYDTQSFTVMDFSTHYYDYAGSTWKIEYNFGQTYGKTPCTANTSGIIYGLLGSDDGARQNFMSFYDVNNADAAPVTQSNWKAYWCGIGWLTGTDFTACYAPAASGSALGVGGGY